MPTKWTLYKLQLHRTGLLPSLQTLQRRNGHHLFSKFAASVVFSFCFLVIFSSVVGCGYVSTSSYLEHIKSINIRPVEVNHADIAYDNISQRPFDEVIHEKLSERFNRKWNDGNDSELTIKIQHYDIKEHGFGPSGNVELVRMSLQVEYQFIDKVRNNLIEKRDNHVQIHDFYVVENRGEPPETTDQAKNLIIEELIEDLYNQLAEQW